MPNIATNGLIGYWHYKKDVSGNVWKNIAPDTFGRYNGQINGSLLSSSGMKFDGVDDYVRVSDINATLDNMTIEFWIKYNSESPTGYFFSTHYGMSDFFLIGAEGSIPAVVFFDVDKNVQLVMPDYDFSINSNQYYHISVTSTKSHISLYANGNLLLKTEDQNIGSKIITSNFYIGIGIVGGGEILSSIDGLIASVKLYNRVLSEQEIKENYNVGQDFVLSEESTHPVPTVLSISKNKISPIAQMNESAIKFKFNKNVTRWEVRVLGSGQGSGTLADSGGPVAANTEITAVVDSTELYQEGQNRINIYGLGTDGSWTPYE